MSRSDNDRTGAAGLAVSARASQVGIPRPADSSAKASFVAPVLWWSWDRTDPDPAAVAGDEVLARLLALNLA